jgi:hypothetical protein
MKLEQSERAWIGRVVLSFDPVPVSARKQLSGVHVAALGLISSTPATARPDTISSNRERMILE